MGKAGVGAGLLPNEERIKSNKAGPPNCLLKNASVALLNLARLAAKLLAAGKNIDVRR